MAVSSDGVVTATIMSDGATVELVVDFSVAGSPISGTAGNVYSLTVFGATSTAVLATAGAAGSTAWVVRGLSQASAPGGALVGADHEAPFGVALYYKAVAYGVTGTTLGTSTSVTITMPAPLGAARTWLKCLSMPLVSEVVSTQTLPDWSGDIAQGVIWIEGRSDPIVTQGVRQFETGTLEVLTRSVAGEAAFLALLTSPGPYLLQMPGSGLADCYVTVGKYTRKRQVNKFGATDVVWTLPLTQVIRPPVAGWSVAVPGKTYADSQAALPLYSNRTGTYKSRAV